MEAEKLQLLWNSLDMRKRCEPTDISQLRLPEIHWFALLAHDVITRKGGNTLTINSSLLLTGEAAFEQNLVSFLLSALNSFLKNQKLLLMQQ